MIKKPKASYDATRTTRMLRAPLAMRSDTTLEQGSPRWEVLKRLINLVHFQNNQVPPVDSQLDLYIQGWHTVLEHVPTIHLRPIYQFVVETKMDTFPVTLNHIAAAWAGRYDESRETDPPGPHQSPYRDEQGNYRLKDEMSQSYSFGIPNIKDARALARYYRTLQAFWQQ